MGTISTKPFSEDPRALHWCSLSHASGLWRPASARRREPRASSEPVVRVCDCERVSGVCDCEVCVSAPLARSLAVPNRSHKTQPVVAKQVCTRHRKRTTQKTMAIMDTSDAHACGRAICEELTVELTDLFHRRQFEAKQSAPASSSFRLQRSSALADWRIGSVVEVHIARQNLLIELDRCHQ